ncbi:MAG TPA: creatininase family protein [Bryobacteraceae bacterium]|nr:creatininase family protein [Bryobacteraceae bacterium]
MLTTLKSLPMRRPFRSKMMFFLSIASLALLGQDRSKLRTRDVTRLSQIEIADYLKRSDVIFVPVGAIEAQGVLPSDREYVAPLGMAIKMAEEADAVYLPYLAYFYPGSTITSAATVYMSLSEGETYLKIIAKSLLRQGYRRQIWVTMGHGPSPLTVGTMVRAFFEETHVPILNIEVSNVVRAMKGDYSKMMYGEYSMLGRLGDIPLSGEAPKTQRREGGAAADDPGLATLTKMGLAGSLTLGYWWSDPEGHGIGGSLPATEAERIAWAKEGAAEMDAVVKSMDLKTVLRALRDHDQFTQEMIVPKFEKMLPSDDSSER